MQKAPLHLLLVEDLLSDAVFLQELLEISEESHIHLFHVKNLKEALVTLSQNTFDLILLDLFLPDSKGLETLRHINTVAKKVPIVVLTGLQDKSIAIQSVKEGAQDYLIKGKINQNSLMHSIQFSIERKQILDRVSHLAHHDPLTGLHNRQLFLNQLEKSLSRAKRFNESIAVLFLDLDHFKQVNDTLGHDYGDLLLKRVAFRMQECVRSSDTICRLGGDEFAIVAEQFHDADEVTDMARRIIAALEVPIQLNHEKISISSSIGISFYPQHGTDEKDLLKNADTSMYEAKKQGGARFKVYSKDILRTSLKSLNLERQIRLACENREFAPYYQPQVNLQTGEVWGVEVLMRWLTKENVLELPNFFVPLLEKLNLINQIEEQNLSTALDHNRLWCLDNLPPLQVFINLSAKHLQDEKLIDWIEKLLEESKFDPQLLGLEFTEEAILKHEQNFRKTFPRLKKMGVKLILDDFGVGYTSLNLLKYFPFDIIKIDSALVQKIEEDEADLALLTLIISLAEKMGSRVHAEGVETGNQCQFLLNQGCENGQGYYFSPPLAQDSFQGWFQNRISTAGMKK